MQQDGRLSGTFSLACAGEITVFFFRRAPGSYLSSHPAPPWYRENAVQIAPAVPAVIFGSKLLGLCGTFAQQFPAEASERSSFPNPLVLPFSGGPGFPNPVFRGPSGARRVFWGPPPAT